MTIEHVYPRESTKRKNIHDALVQLIATDLQPVSIVEDQGFKNYVHTLDSRYEVPSHCTIMSRLPETYQSVKRKLQGQLNNTTHIALTTDVWTSLQTKYYCCILPTTSQPHVS